LILVLAAAGLAAACLGPGRWLTGTRRTAACWLGFYTVVLATGYSVIPYKTPWCVLQFLIGLILLAGVGAVAMVRATPTVPLKALLAIVLAGFGGQLAWQTYRTAYVLPADPVNPWVYAHTRPDIERLSQGLEQLAAAVPAGRATPVKVVWAGAYYWPLPWYLRGWDHVQLWTHLPDDARAPIVISSPGYDAELTKQLDDTHLMTGYYGIRTNELVQLWVRIDVWEAHLRRLGRL
jgi:predicted membrane-bound mannosyltransferase